MEKSVNTHNKLRYFLTNKIFLLYVEHFLLPTDAHNVKKRRVIKTF